MAKFLYKPVLSIMDKRARDVQELLEESRRSRQETEGKFKEAEGLLQKAAKDIIDMKERSRIEADRTRKAILNEAKKEKERFLDSARRELNKEAESAKKSIRGHMADFSIAIAEKVLRREIKKEDHTALIKKTLEEIGHDEFPQG